MRPTLLILAAGMASRYGSMKQTESFGPSGETIMDYSIYDAIQAGFGKVVFIIREDFAEPFKANFEKMPSLKPAFEKEGTITAANASTINDGAAAVVLAGDAFASEAEFKILSFASHAQNPTWFSTAPVEAIHKSLKKAGLTMNQIDLFEVNEAFAAVTMAAMKECHIPHEKINVFGGAVALGHPIGASGARILVTLMNAMKKKKAKFGCTAICIGGGEALSLVIERLK
jgi:acetyl-CoA C-acetyltransferase